jgi:predicted acylesterase/phospholipase RssA
VLDEFMRAGFNPFDLMLGTSAGAQNLSAYMCNQQGYARKVITRYTTSRQFFDPMRFVRGGNLIDLDWLVEATSQQMPLAMNYAEAQFALGKELWLCACRGDDYSASYFSPTPQTWLDLIRASSAIPGFYRSGVLLDGVSYLDGGVSDAIPVQEAARRGAQTIVVIRTVPSQMFYTPQWFKRMERWLGRAACSRWSIWCTTTKTLTALSSSSSRSHPASCGSSKSTRSGHCAVWRLAVDCRRCWRTTKPDVSVAAISWRRWVNCWPTSRRCCAMRRVLPGLRRWWCRPYRWPMKRLRRLSFLHRRRMTPALIMRIWHEPPFYRYPLPLRFSSLRRG